MMSKRGVGTAETAYRQEEPEVDDAEGSALALFGCTSLRGGPAYRRARRPSRPKMMRTRRLRNSSTRDRSDGRGQHVAKNPQTLEVELHSGGNDSGSLGELGELVGRVVEDCSEVLCHDGLIGSSESNCAEAVDVRGARGEDVGQGVDMGDGIVGAGAGYMWERRTER